MQSINSRKGECQMKQKKTNKLNGKKAKLKRWFSMCLAFAIMCFTMMQGAVTAHAAGPSILYRSHCQNIGWGAYVSNGASSGSIGQSLRMESLAIKISGMSGGVEYEAHVQNIGWQGVKRNGENAGTTGQSLQMEAVKIRLTGEIAKYYDVAYRTHVQNIGWQSWKSNGEVAGTTGQSLRIEAIEIKLVPKSGNASSGNTVANTSINTANGYLIQGVNIGYSAGSYFTDNGRACTDHGTKGIHSYYNENACNCICTYNGKSLGAVQCYGFARYVQTKLYGVNSYDTPSKFYKISGSTVAAGALTPAKIKSLVQTAGVGAHIRTSGSQHSMIITNITNDGFTIIQCNGSNNQEYSGYYACRIGTYTYTWNSYVSSTYGQRGLSFIERIK